MARTTRVSKKNQSELAQIRDLPIENLKGALHRLAAADSEIVTPKSLREILGEAAGDDGGAALGSQLVAVEGYMRAEKITPDEAVDAITGGLAESGWSEDELAKWLPAADIFKEMLALPNVHHASKALSLTFECDYLFEFANVVTDIRPIFSKEKENVAGAIIYPKLFIRYEGDDTRHSISLVLDRDDIEGLLRSCQDALREIDAAKSFIEVGKAKAIYLGEDL
jgi:hypothetical protein